MHSYDASSRVAKDNSSTGSKGYSRNNVSKTTWTRQGKILESIDDDLSKTAMTRQGKESTDDDCSARQGKESKDDECLSKTRQGKESIEDISRTRQGKESKDDECLSKIRQDKESIEDISRTRQGKVLESIDDDCLLVNQIKGDLNKKAKMNDTESSHTQFGPDHLAPAKDKFYRSEHHDECAQDSNLATSAHQTSHQDKTNGDFDDEDEQSWRKQSEYFKNIDTKAFRQYELACDRVKQFYEEQHQKQTVAYNIQARINFKTKVRAKMSVWEGLERLNKLLDDSDPDTELSQIDHALQTAQAIRKDNKPRWFQLVGLIHDLGKLLYFFDSRGQWDVVGDTFPVGCKFSKKIIFPESFKKNPDILNPLYNTKYGIYSKHCGLDNVMLSWGHDEYMYHVAKNNSTLPAEALAMIRYHSFYPWHQEAAYSYLMNDHDKEMLKAVRAFNVYDLYSKIDEQHDVDELKEYYKDLIDEYFPTKIIDF